MKNVNGIVLEIVPNPITGQASVVHKNGSTEDEIFTGTPAECLAFQRGMDFGVRIALDVKQMSGQGLTKQ